MKKVCHLQGHTELPGRQNQSHYIEVAQGNILMEQNIYEIWAGFGLVGNNEKKNWGQL
jgi:hypothetical protein